MAWRVQLLWANVTADPSADGLPGAAFVQQILNWAAQIALWGSLAALLIGAALWGMAESAGNGYQAGTGRKMAIGGALGAALAALAPEIVNALFDAANGTGGAPPPGGP